MFILHFRYSEEFTRLKEEIPDGLIDAHLSRGKQETENGAHQKDVEPEKTDPSDNDKKGNFTLDLETICCKRGVRDR